MNNPLSNPLDLAQALAREFSTFPEVQAIALGGSLGRGAGDTTSDIDLYVYGDSVVPLEARQEIVTRFGASQANLNLDYWDLGDEWFHAATGIEVDMMFWSPAWIEGMLEQVLVHQRASLGYTTCFWHTLRYSQALYDPHGWYAALQARADQPYPAGLRQAIISRNHPLLRAIIPSYFNQIKKAAGREDWVSTNHRLAALFASYFDILFALNRELHPGEKRLVSLAQQRCGRLPADFRQDTEAVLQAAGGPLPVLLAHLDSLLEHLDELLAEDGFRAVS